MRPLKRRASFLISLWCSAVLLLCGGFLAGCERESEVVSASAVVIPSPRVESPPLSAMRPGPSLGSETEAESLYLPPTPVAYPYTRPIVPEGEYRVHINHRFLESGWSDGARIWFRGRRYANELGLSAHYTNQTLYVGGRAVDGPYQWNGHYIYADLYALTRRTGLRFEPTEMFAIVFRPLVVTSRPVPRKPAPTPPP